MKDLVITRKGIVSIKENIEEFKELTIKTLMSYDPSNLKTDEDFERGAVELKELKAARKTIQVASESLDLDNIKKVKATLAELEKLVFDKSKIYSSKLKDRKEERKAELCHIYYKKFFGFESKFTPTFGEFESFVKGELIKGMSSFKNMEEKLNEHCLKSVGEVKLKETAFKTFFDMYNLMIMEADVIREDEMVLSDCIKGVNEWLSEEEFKARIQSFIDRYNEAKQAQIAKKLEAEKAKELESLPEKKESDLAQKNVDSEISENTPQENDLTNEYTFKLPYQEVEYGHLWITVKAKDPEEAGEILRSKPLSELDYDYKAKGSDGFEYDLSYAVLEGYEND